MSLEFLGMDEELKGACPHCNRLDGGLIYSSFSSKPLSCESCMWAMKAEGQNVAYLERLRKERNEAYLRGMKAVKELALELGRKRLERMNR